MNSIALHLLRPDYRERLRRAPCPGVQGELLSLDAVSSRNGKIVRFGHLGPLERANRPKANRSATFASAPWIKSKLASSKGWPWTRDFVEFRSSNRAGKTTVCGILWHDFSPRLIERGFGDGSATRWHLSNASGPRIGNKSAPYVKIRDASDLTKLQVESQPQYDGVS
jgi:hypothetical protein